VVLIFSIPLSQKKNPIPRKIQRHITYVHGSSRKVVFLVVKILKQQISRKSIQW